MPTHKFDAKAESNQFELLPDGDYAFEVVGVDAGIQTGSGKTAGSDVIDLKVAFYTDATFAKRRAQWTENLIFHETTAWKISVFTKAANMLVNGKPPADGDEVDYSAATLIGLRGWATVGSKPGYKDPAKKFNTVVAWITNKEKLPRNTPKPAPADDDIPF